MDSPGREKQIRSRVNFLNASIVQIIRTKMEDKNEIKIAVSSATYRVIELCIWKGEL